MKRKQRRYNRIEVLDFIERYQREHRGRSPSQRHISRALAMSAPSRANYAVRKLQADGLLDAEHIERGLALQLIITETGVNQLQRWRDGQPALSAQCRTQRGVA